MMQASPWPSSLAFPERGDAKHSPFFEEYLPRLLEGRDRLGLTGLIRGIDALMLTVEPGNAIAYIGELALMSAYRYVCSHDSPSHWSHVLRIDDDCPDVLIREVKHEHIRGLFRSLNEVYPVGLAKPHSRYIGEVLRVTDLAAVVKLQQRRDFGFFSPQEVARLELPANLAICKPSPYTHTIVAYVQRQPGEPRHYALGRQFVSGPAELACAEAKARQQALGVAGLLLPVDHLATRVFSQNRELAVLEWLSLSCYYHWGTLDIVDQNSATTVTQCVHAAEGQHSPAKVFTAGDTPYFVNHLKIAPSPTESFVRNCGPRLHHLALAVKDGQTLGMDNIDYVVNAISGQGKSFLLDVVGSKREGLRQIFASTCERSSLIIEYVQRFDSFDGYFHKDNVAELTYLAGIEEELVRRARLGA